MALNFPVLLPQTGEALANYNYVDIAEGTGIQVFYLGKTASSAILRKNVFYSNYISTSGAISSGGYTKDLEQDFDVSFNIPKIIKGTGNLTLPVVVSSLSNPGTVRGRFDVRLIKVSGGTSTEISAVSGAIILSQNGASQARMQNYEIPCPQTHFKAGDVLRLRIQGFGILGVGAGELIIGHDPKGRASGAFDFYSFNPGAITIAEFQVPFKIEI